MLPDEAPTRRDVSFLLMVAAVTFFMAIYGVVTLYPSAFGMVALAFAAGFNAGIVLEYNRVKNLSGWKEKPPASE